MKKYWLSILCILIGVGLFFASQYLLKSAIKVTNFEECATIVGRVMESYPRQCAYKGRTYVEELAVPPPPVSSAPVQNISVVANSVIASPLSLTGEALGSWFFEASFPFKVLDANDNVLGSGLVQASGNWMTTSYIPFTAGATFIQTPTQTGFLVFEKDNPSGEPANDGQYRVPVKFY